MKRFLMIGLLCLGATLTTKGQMIISYDYNTGTYTYNGEVDQPKCVKAGDKVVFKIAHINRLLLDVGFNKTVNTFHTTAPAIPTIGSVPLFISAAAEKAISDSVKVDYDEWASAYARVIDDLKDVNDLWVQLDDWNLTDAEISAIMVSAKRVSGDQLIDNLNQLEAAYLELINNNSTEDAIIKQIIRIQTALDGKDLRTYYTTLRKVIDHIDSTTFEYVSPEIVASGDELVIDITIDPKEGKKSLPISATKLQVSQNVSRTWRYSFSTGLFYTSLAKQAFTNRPNLVTDPATSADTVSTYTLIKEDASSGSIGVGGYFHYSYHPNCKVGLGLNIGAGVDLEEKVNYMVGASLILGHKQRLLINGGFSWAQIDQLSDALVEGVTTNAALEISTVKKVKNGLYISLSYNLL